MAPAVMVLGPSRWQSGPGGHDALEHDPLRIREEIVGMFRSLGVAAVLMEAFEPEEGEDNMALFLRIIREEHVRAFVLFWPLGARLHGLSVEVGHLLTRIQEGLVQADDVYLLAEKKVLGVEPDEGTVAWSERGNRTRYYQDLVAGGCSIRQWSTERSLWGHVGAIALGHQSRHG